ncbi:hypothetical protein G3570_06655 [Balneolaceae bacterium YR4-1]|uniref:Secreted protein n=1 Tax=Halalkalibaculum roseum TaxID=2709311 RepID=A0A6M1T2S7_9BACT|nr:hypothetical protein [Halalkalibaculum roseum]NGP76305.1 hypothetical protein [Halalkalibaculum roseum]
MKLIKIASCFFIMTFGVILTSNAQSSSNQFFPFGATIDVCGELVDFEGVFHPVFKIGDNGGFQVLDHINARGTGVGQTSGTVYNWNDTINFHLKLAGASTQTRGQTWVLVPRGGGETLLLKSILHITLNQNSFNVTVDNFSVSCL